jgi:hypothetical protein
MGGHIFCGLLELILAGTGFVLIMIFFYHLFRTLFQFQQLAPALAPYTWLGKLGALLFLAGWLLALVTSLRILRQTPK